MTPFNEAVMLETLERLERENEDLKARITALEMLANDAVRKTYGRGVN